MKKPSNSWNKYGVNNSSEWSEFTEIYHVTHIKSALRIVEDKKISASSIYDSESQLFKRDIMVCWLSPNTWEGAGGSRYGNIQYHFCGNVKSVHNCASYLIQAIIFNYAYDRNKAVKYFVESFSSKKDFIRSFLAYFQKKFNFDELNFVKIKNEEIK